MNNNEDKLQWNSNTCDGSL